MDIQCAGVSGDQKDIILCEPGSIGSTTSCTYSMYWDGSAYGMSQPVNAIHIELGDTVTATPTDIPTGNNLLQNPDFESGLDAWDSWNGELLFSSDAYSGSQALAIGPGEDSVWQYVDGVPEETYVFSGWAKADPGEVAQIGVKFFDVNESELSGLYITITATTYQLFSISEVAPADTAFVVVWFWKEAGSGYHYVDALSLSTATVATPTSTATPTTGALPTNTPTPSSTATPTSEPTNNGRVCAIPFFAQTR